MTFWQCAVTLVSGRTGACSGIFVLMRKKVKTAENWIIGVVGREIKTKIFLSILAVEGRLKRVARSGEEESWTISGKLNGFKIRKKIANVL